ncbi:SDR family oxidoreductase [Roseateles puraquae]|jgi:NAD(P)-dependent dehydrogenase (short-subunit alcohol dehydrogenase family)|uniref:Short-chain dehydrogenase n=1 Tax=Roseateles puraquae TaxID=431059 RepID=A0A254NHI5_9BURK|nr:SDR family oxidoreductase [Roseateles puraquae]MDG0853682.1 SDR family oxidoreductase [Roseateles puraquae]OWR06142.1 short-chain dehydrogenase [Roseateles puraquae]
MNLSHAVVLITGANRGLGRAFAEAALAAGAAKVYAAARDPASIDLPGVVPLRLDVTDPAQVAAAAAECRDVTLLINNAGILRGGSLLATEALAAARAELETNFFGPWLLARAFAPVLAANGGGAVLNVLSALSWVSLPGSATYSASKAAAWALSNGLRQELRAQGTQVTSLHVGYMDTDMVRGVAGPKASPADVARQALQALAAGDFEVLADEVSRQVKQSLSTARPAYAG